MTALFMESFNVYGPGENLTAMEEGQWASVSGNIGVPAWGARTGEYSYNAFASNIGAPTSRFVIPTAPDKFYVSFGFSVQTLPPSGSVGIWSLYDSGGNEWLRMRINVDGSLTLYTNSADGLVSLGSTDGPAIGTQQWYAFEALTDLSGGAGAHAFTLNVNGTAVITLTSLTFNNGSATATNANLMMLDTERINSDEDPGMWFSDLYIHDALGDYNNSWLGDIRLNVIYPDANGPDQGWTGYPRSNPAVTPSAGILDNTVLSRGPTAGGLYVNGSSATDIGAGDYTVEGFFRFGALPTGSNLSVLVQKWDATNSAQSWQLALCGPSVNAGNIIFQYTTDGTNDTLVMPINYPYAFQTDHWYHIAVVRASGELLLFINGVQQGVPVADTGTPFVSTEEPLAIGNWIEHGGNNPSPDGYYLNGWANQVRLTVGYARYTSNFTTPNAPFPTGSADTEWSKVAFLLECNGGFTDASTNAATIHVLNGQELAFEIDDSAGNYELLDYKLNAIGVLRDDTFIEADLVPATGTLTFTNQPANTSTVTVGTEGAGGDAAVYTFKTVIADAFDVLIDTTLAGTVSNLMNAINLGAGGGTKYGNGTVVNNDVTASSAQGLQVIATANVPGTAGNSIASTVSGTVNASWGGSTLAGGASIPGYSDFSYQRPPADTTAVYAAQFQTRMYKVDGGNASVQVTLVGAEGGTESGTAHALSGSAGTPNYYNDTFEEDPDTGSGITVSTIIGLKGRFNRTV